MNIAVYCSSREQLAPQYEETGRIVGEWIGRNGHELVYGGVNAGLMHITSQAAHDFGAKITGVVPECFKHRADALNDRLILTHDLNDRKQKIIELADAFVVLPGGLGTIDEWMSTLSQLVVDGDTTRRIIVANIDNVYGGIIKQIEDTAHSDFARSSIIEMSVIANTASELKDILTNINKIANHYEK